MTETRRNIWISLAPVLLAIAIQTTVLAFYLGGLANEVKAIGKALEGKASIESVTALDARTKVVERKVDRIDRQVAAHVGIASSVYPNN